jgi:hypothetical protein
MSIDLSAIHLSPLAWLAIIIVLGLIVLGIVRTFFQHLLHLVLRGCGLIVLIIAVWFVLRLLKVI